MDIIRSLSGVLVVTLLPGLVLGQPGNPIFPANKQPGVAAPPSPSPQVQPLQTAPAATNDAISPSLVPDDIPGKQVQPTGSIDTRLRALDTEARRGMMSLEEYRERQRRILRGR